MAMQALLIENDSIVRVTVARMLTHAGFTVIEVPDGEVALKMATLPKLRLIISDLALPGSMTGLSLIRDLKKTAPSCPLIAMSGCHTNDLESATLECGADSFLGKPFCLSMLLATIQRFIPDLQDGMSDCHTASA